MVEASIIESVRRYLASLPNIGIHARRAVLFGSFARGEANEWSDIDLVVIAPEFDRRYNHALAEDLWGARANSDIRIEPIPCGEKEWEEDGSRPILEIARREGIVIDA
jgi:predicted nucleotidyltransferase